MSGFIYYLDIKWGFNLILKKYFRPLMIVLRIFQYPQSRDWTGAALIKYQYKVFVHVFLDIDCIRE